MVKRNNSSSGSSKLGKQLYSGAADFGRDVVTIQSIFGAVIGLALLGGGIYVSTLKDKHTETAQGTITAINDSACLQAQQQDGAARSCQYKVTFSVGQNVKTVANVSSTTAYAVGQTVTVHYDPANPQQAELQMQPYKQIGFFMIFFSLFLLGATYAQYYLTRRHKFLAAAEGVGAGVRVVRGAFQ